MSFVPIANYSSYSFIPGFDVGNMVYFGPEVELMANNDNRKKLIEQRSKKNVDKPSINTSVDTKYSPSLIDRVIGGFKVGGQAYGNIFGGRPLMTGIDQTLEDIEKGVIRNEEGEIIYQGEADGKVVKVETKEDDYKKFEDYMGMNVEDYMKMLAGRVQENMAFSAGLGQLGAGISSIANAPSLVGQSALQAARDMGDVTIANMGAMAAQNRVMEANPTKTRFAGRYFR